MIHYIYKIINLTNNKEYIGVRSHIDPQNDNYMGSSTILKKDIMTIGLCHFEKQILEFYKTRCEAELREAELVNKDYIKRADTYNMRTGGSMGHPMQSIRYDVYNNSDAIIQQYKNGESAEQIAHKFFVDANVIRNIIPKGDKRTQSEANKLTRKKYPTACMRSDINKHKEEIIKHYDDGESVDSIAMKYKCNRDVIKRILKESGVTMRSMSDQQKLRSDLKQPRRRDLWSRISEIIDMLD